MEEVSINDLYQNSEDTKNTSPLGLLPVAVIIEGLITYLNNIFFSSGFCYQMFLSLIIGISFSAFFSIDIMKYFNMTAKYKIVNYIVTGILLSRGSNYIFDLFKAIKS